MILTEQHFCSRLQELIAKNERTKALIKKRDEQRKLKNEQLLEQSTVMTSYIRAEQKH